MAVKDCPFKSMYNRPATIAAETGTMYDKAYTMVLDKNGHKHLKCTGETNRYAKIQSHLDECLVENILAKATMDPSVLNKRHGTYFDSTQMPKTLAEAQNAILALNQEFEKLPAEIKQKFNNSPEQYVAAYGSKEWGDKMGLIKKVTEETKKETKEEKEELKNAE